MVDGVLVAWAIDPPTRLMSFAHALQTAKAKHTRPTRNAAPPIGVIAPSQLNPLKLIM